MSDKVFRLKLIFLNGVIEIVNSSNKAFQNQSMEIHNLYSEAVKCIKTIARLFINPNCLPEDISRLKDLAWNTDDAYIP